MSRIAAKLLAATTALPLAAALILAPTPARADWHGGYGGYRGGYHSYHGYRGAYGIVGGALLGLGLGAVLAAPYVASPPVVYAAPPAYYVPPQAYYAPPPAYAAPPGYYAAAPAPYYYGR